MFRNRRRYGRSRISSFILTFVIVLAIGMGIGYAAIATTLTIDGTSDIDSANWDIHFENVQVNGGSVTVNTPTITDDTTVSFSVSLENPGDYYEFTVDVVNDGTLDAKVDSVTILPILTQEQQNYLKYEVTYNDGFAISVNDPLDAGVSEKIKIRFEYLTQTDTTLYPAEDTNLEFSTTIVYVQGKGNSINGTYYTFNDTNIKLDAHIPYTVELYDTYQDAIAASGVNVFTKQVISHNIIMESYIGFVKDDNVYYFRGYKNVLNGAGSLCVEVSPYYESNIELALNVFGSSNCSIGEGNVLYACSLSNFNFLSTSCGDASVSENGVGACGVSPIGESICAKA